MKNELIQRAIDCLGGQQRLADAVGVTQASVSYWLAGQNVVSAESAVSIERVTNGVVTRRELRPDLYEGMVEEVSMGAGLHDVSNDALATWTMEAIGPDKVVLSRWYQGQVVERFRPMTRAEAGVSILAVLSGYQPPRALLYLPPVGWPKTKFCAAAL